jgi:hypothetical protein
MLGRGEVHERPPAKPECRDSVTEALLCVGRGGVNRLADLLEARARWWRQGGEIRVYVRGASPGLLSDDALRCMPATPE